MTQTPPSSAQERGHWLGWDERACDECHKAEGTLELVSINGDVVRMHGACREKVQEEIEERIVDACSDCHGTGRYDDVMPCEFCDGEGVLDF